MRLSAGESGENFSLDPALEMLIGPPTSGRTFVIGDGQSWIGVDARLPLDVGIDRASDTLESDGITRKRFKTSSELKSLRMIELAFESFISL